MKRAGGLFERVLAYENLRLAFWRASRGKRERDETRAYRQRLDAEVGAGLRRHDVKRLIGPLIRRPVVVRQPRAASVRMQLEVAPAAKLLRRRSLHPRKRRITVVEAPVARCPGLIQQYMHHADPVRTAVVDIYIPEVTLICRFCSLSIHGGFLVTAQAGDPGAATDAQYSETDEI
mgnify:CR=1 FL=1